MKKPIIILLVFFLFVSCSKDNNPVKDIGLQLPVETQTGANIFGCYINGQLLIPRDGSGTVGSTDSGFSLWGDPTGNQQYSEIDVRDYKSKKTAKILIHIQSIHQLGIGNYIIEESNGMSNIDGFNHNYIHCRVFNYVTNSYQYYRSYTNSGILKITRYDFIPSVKLIISGTFNCKLINPSNPNDEIEITQGRFDLDGATLPNKIFL